MDRGFPIPDGQTQWFSCQYSPVLTEEEETDGVCFGVLDMTDRKRMEEQLQAALKEKEAMMTEIHHRVKNNLQIVSTLLDFQADYVQDDHTLNVLRDSQRRVQSMAMIHPRLF